MISCGFLKHPQCYWSLLPLLLCLPCSSLTKALPRFSLFVSPASWYFPQNVSYPHGHFLFSWFLLLESWSSFPNSIGCRRCLCWLPRSPVVEDNTHFGDRIWPGWEAPWGLPSQCWKVVCKLPKEKSSQKSYPAVMCKAYEPQWHHGLNMAAQPVFQQWQH